MISRRWFPSLLLMFLLPAAPLRGQDSAAERASRHSSVEWLTVAPHLPDAQTASPDTLEMAGDILRARRFPEDALDYYRFALQRGGDVARLMNRIGVTELELRRPTAARIAFKQVLAVNKKDSEGWNNLGAAEYVQRNFTAAIFDYRRAVKLNKKGAVFHSNLGTAYFEQKDYEGARKEFQTALKLDPAVFQRGGWGGVEAHVLSPEDRGRFCFEMARMVARVHDDAGVLLWLGRASETGYDILREMDGVREMEAYRIDPRVALIIKNAKAMRKGQLAASTPPPLAADEANRH